MTESQRLALRRSEIRSRLAAIGGMADDAVTDEIRSERDTLSTEFQHVEARWRAAVISEGGEPEVRTVQTGDPETREREELRSRCSIATFVRAAAEGRAVYGAEAEYAAAHGVGTMQRIPLDLFPRARRAEPGIEARAITPGPAVDGPPMPAVPYVFERTALAALGVQMPMTGAGQVQIPRVTTTPPADTVAKDGAAPSTAAAVALDSEAPKRIAGQFEVRVEDLAVYPELESVLSEAMRGALQNELDEQGFNGTGASGDLDGLFNQATNVNAAGAVETYITGISRFASLVDGRYAYSLGDVSAVIGPSTFALYSGVFANANKGDVSLMDALQMKLGSIRVSDRIPAVASMAQKGLVMLNAGPSPARIYVWNALEIVRDPYSGAGAGKVTITATALVSDVYVPHGTSMLKEVHPKLS